ncbi:MAG: adenosylcobinamide-GDP ribazoletransferase [Bacteroidetes bacterium GWA2_31_9b]|nr:MAG: adenosylcobinamide-GDP ribazoletransferase [Bacteroidetes bacterium GWA2_31_9b]
MKKQGYLFLTAIMFYTRIPVPKSIVYSDDLLNKSTKYFPFVGWIVGGFGALVFYATQFILPLPVSVLMSMISTILLTGAFHEDGFADSCDAFGGGWTKEKILEIMKDSRIGTYGSVGLILILFTKFYCLSSVPVKQIPFILIAAHAFSRYVTTGIIFFSEYAREDASTKSKPVGKSLSSEDYFISFIFGSTPLLILSILYSYWLLLILLTTIPIVFFLKRYFEKWIGGFTGDALGATQQITEIVFYLSSIIIYHFI